MRPIERIDNFLNNVDWNELIKRWNIENIDSFFTSAPLYIASEWKKDPDLTFGQLLINKGDVSDNLQIWMDEEHDILIDQGIAPEECLYWTSNYDKDMNPIKPINRLIKDLETDHINKIYLYMMWNNRKLSNKYQKAFRNVLISRNESTKIIDFIETLWKLEKIGE